MPMYVHHCPACDFGFEEFRKMSESAHVPQCPSCGHVKTDRVITMPRVTVAAEKRSDDDLTRQHYGLKPGQQVHTNYLTQERLVFDKGTPKWKSQEAIRQSYIKAGLKDAEDPGSVRVKNS